MTVARLRNKQERKYPNAMGSLIITNGLIVPMTESRDSFRGYVRIENDTIVELAGGTPHRPNGCEVIDGRGCVVMPGLINAHTHLYQVLLRAVWEDLPLLSWLKRIYGAALVLRPDHFYAGSLWACIEAVRGGVTTVCEHNFLNPHPECAFETLRAIRESGVRAVFARTIMDAGEIVPDCVKEQPEPALRHVEQLISAARGNERLSFMTGPNTPPLNTTPELLREIRRFADAMAIGVSAHVAESRSIVDFTRERYGKPGVVRLLDDVGIAGRNSIFAHCVHVSPEEVAILRERGASVSHNPVSNMMLGDGIAPVVEMLRQGVNVALGTDGAASNHSQDLFETMKAASLLQKVAHENAGVIDPYAVLRMATAGGAHALGLASVCGTLEVGKRADVILVDLETAHNQPVNDLFSQLVHCAKAADVRTTIVGGEILMRDRALQRVDERAALERARAANRDLMARLQTLEF
ncbi:MAG TPA: amidohydrolase [Candidatus Eisenbacteria bacterium]|nr:amidohydrolase [Candidatus Eisenbacteria bacterium]